jgi:hypothetical protein
MAEFFSKFSKGLTVGEFREIEMPNDTYSDGWNFIRRINGTPFNENGTKTIANFPADLRVLGSTVLENDVILFLSNNTSHEIGVLSNLDTYTTIVNSVALNFNIGFPIEATPRKDFKGDRVVYWTDNYNPPRILDLDNIDLDDLSLFLTSTIPVIEDITVLETGNLPTGVYQFAARQLTSSTNATAFGLISNVIPIVDELRSSGRDVYDGALPQTQASKAISINVANLDPKFSFLEIAAITYNGLSNQYEGSIVAVIPMNGRTEVPFTYSDFAQKKYNLSLEELVQEFPNYIKAKCIEQKDGRLFLSNLTSADLNIDFQKVANNIVLKYSIEEVAVPFENIDLKVWWDGTYEGSENGQDNGSSSPSYNDYKKEELTTTKKGYRREEVYSFAICPIIDGNIIGAAYHIPGGNLSTTTTTDANTTTKVLGTYVSTSEYPTNFGYPRTDNTDDPAVNNKVRHHKFPSVKDEPHYRLDGSTYYVRIMGVRVDEDAIDLSVLGEDAARVTGYILVRQPRLDEYKSVLSQGVAQNLYTSDDTTSPGPYTNFYVTPHTGKAGFYGYNTLTPVSTAYTSDQGGNLVAFYSPETTILQKSLTVTQIGAVARVVGKSHVAAVRHNATTGSDSLQQDNYFHSLLNYEELETLSSLTRQSIDTSTAQYIPADDGAGDSFYSPNNTAIKVWNESSNGFYFFRLATGILSIENPLLDGRPEFYLEDDDVGTEDWFWLHNLTDTASERFDGSFGSTILDGADETMISSTNRLIYNLYASKPNQYGDIYDAKYMYVGHHNGELSDEVFFSGDTFIGKVALVSKTRRRTTDGLEVDLNERYFTTSYVWLESEVNTNYRHYVAPTGQNTIGTIPYYPKNKVFFKEDGTGMYEVPPTYGHSTGYNKQYSFENTLKYYFPKQLAQEDVTLFENRTIYSEQSIEGEQFDAYRSFLSNNYHDIPKNKGAIVDTFVFNGSFYIHTSQSLWKAAVNEKVTQVTSAGETTLGNGGLFPRPSEEMFTINGGYAGTQSQFAGCNTPYGRFFVDNIQGKIFVLGGEGLKEISNDANMFKFFQEKLKPVLIDNPTCNQGWISIYDYANKRWLLTNTGQTLKPEYWGRYKGVYQPENSTFMDSLIAGESIVMKDGQFMIFNG